MIIAFGHKARVGKTTAANFLVKEFGFTKMAFADPLKLAAKEIFSFNDDQLYGNLKEVVDPFWGMTPREVFQRLGTESVRGTFGDDVWVKALLRRVQTLERVVIDDVRFPSEADAIKSTGGCLIKLNRTDAKTDFGEHSSEHALNDYTKWDLIVENNSTKEELYKVLSQVCGVPTY